MYDMNSQIISALNWRYATKIFNPIKKVSDKDLHTLLETTRLAPSSLGIHPWKAIVVTDEAVRKQLRAVAWNQSQITDASHLIVFAARKSLDAEYVESYIKLVAQTRNQKIEDVQGYKRMIMGSFAQKTPEAIREWNARQVYIALGFLLESAALIRIDACPMEGFDLVQFDKILKLDTSTYGSVVVAAVGYRSEEDKYALASKVRFPKKDVIAFV